VKKQKNSERASESCRTIDQDTLKVTGKSGCLEEDIKERGLDQSFSPIM